MHHKQDVIPLHNYWLSWFHWESQILTLVFLLKHITHQHDSYITIIISQNYYKESSFYYTAIAFDIIDFGIGHPYYRRTLVQWSSWKFLLYPSWISITLGLVLHIAIAFDKLKQIYVKNMSINCFSSLKII